MCVIVYRHEVIIKPMSGLAVYCAGKLHGFGFIQFDSVGSAEAALRLNGSVLMGRELTVDAASAESGGMGPPVTGEPVEGCWFCLSNPSADVNLIASIGMPFT